ncbi:putative purine nucleotide synthesis repressor [Streptomyces scabiei 87.22]|uniref:Putative purine nucleotide synthesis repressor n=1 Tax=Streptomyces scabiei (strain 87.22) TaxID=680198 RepID=C9YYK9_STRSW|nr:MULTISPECIES: substrate-binding domain-containing protein [Streptomyces]MDW8477723.1 substrate-binding domain-containing protein [Streptomyces scabiei]MDX2537810.1 substrate-binding domain-containing protein [Streptomyces scabiei]MDX2569737.1 substrate-binding domain-containing protein [Streptomyces scabiei]MDX2578915.1 substrate-binding domain-containing protein [Streptomyces scabiei]MDX2631472.1 substrate-binding domain-containing protein [Streptomyces scabiei]
MPDSSEAGLPSFVTLSRRYRPVLEVRVEVWAAPGLGRGRPPGRDDALTSARPPTAIFAGADVAATGVFRAAAELGLRVPDDLSLAGYNNTSVAALEPVSLTSVDQAGAMMGETAARLLLERLEKRRDRAVVMASTPHLVTRGSTAPPRG